MKVKEFVKCLQDDIWLELKVENGLNLACEVSLAKHTLDIDSRGSLEVTEGSVYTYEQNIGYAGIHRNCVVIKCKQ